MNNIKNCEHDFRYLLAKDERVKRICVKCKLKQTSGWHAKDKWFNSYFATFFDENMSDEERIRTWRKEEIKLPHSMQPA